MLNPACWRLLAVKFLAFWKLRPRSWGTNTLLVPNLKVGDQSPPVPTVVAPMLGEHRPPPRRIWSPYQKSVSGSGWLPKFNEDFFVKGIACVITLWWRYGHSFSRDMSQIVENAPSRNVEKSFKKFLDPEADDCQNLINLFTVYRQISGKIFTKIGSVVFT